MDLIQLSEMKKVTIIIPCYNHGKYVKEAIQSALNQTYKNIEIICVNDNSNDNSKQIIEEFKDIVFIDLKENKGVINARNLAIEKSSGEYILPLDADDTIEFDYVEKAVEILNQNPEVGIVYCNVRLFGKKNKIWKLPEFDLDKFLYANCIVSCALYRKKDFLNAGKYKENMKFGYEDWDLWLSILELGLKPYKINETLFNYRLHGFSRSNLTSSDEHWKLQIFKNHRNLFINNEKFISNAFVDKERIVDKLKKYKRINLFLWIGIGILIFILLCLLGMFLR